MDLFTLVARLSLDASDYEKGINSAKTSFVSAAHEFEKVAESAKKVDRDVKAAADAVNNISESTEKAEDIIRAVGDATEQAAEATKKSYREISESNEEVAESYENVGDAASETGDQCEKAAEKQKSPWLSFRERIDKTGDSFEKITAKAVAFGTLAAHAVERAAGALIDFGKNAIQSSADIEAEISLYQQVFGELEAAATGALESISQDTNILATRLRGIGTGAFMQFKGAGIDAGNALSMMDKYTRLAADAAAAYNISVEEADQKLRSFIRGNTEAGDAIGLFTSESQRNERALANYGKKWQELTEAQKQMLMLGVVDEIYNQTEIVGQAAREGHEWENVIGNLNTAFTNLSATVGSPFREALIPVIEKLSEFLSDETVTLRFGMIAAGIGNLAGQAFDGAIDLLDALINWSNGEYPGDGSQIIKDIFSIIGNMSEAAYNGAKSVVDAVLGLMSSDAGPLEQAGEFFSDLKTLTESEGFKTAAEVLGGIFLAFLALNAPLLLVSLTLGAIVTNWKDIKEWANKAYEAFKQFIDTHVPDGFMSGVTSVLNGISGIVSGIYSTWNAFLSSLSSGAAQKGIASVQSAMNSVGISGAVSSAVKNSWWGKLLNGNSTSSGFGGGTSTGTGAGRGFATGLDYVPNDNFYARLHKGEAILTKAEAAEWRRGGSVQSIDYAAMGSAVGSAVREALSGIGLYTDDGTRIADMVTQRVSRNIAREAKNRRFAPVV